MHEAPSYLTQIRQAIMAGMKSGTREFWAPTLTVVRGLKSILGRLCK